jgi:hypothetical protein
MKVINISRSPVASEIGVCVLMSQLAISFAKIFTHFSQQDVHEDALSTMFARQLDSPRLQSCFTKSYPLQQYLPGDQTRLLGGSVCVNMVEQFVKRVRGTEIQYYVPLIKSSHFYPLSLYPVLPICHLSTLKHRRVVFEKDSDRSCGEAVSLIFQNCEKERHKD